MESYLRKPVENKESELEFQALEWVESNEEVSNGDDDMDIDGDEEVYNSYVVRAFGVTKKGESVCLKVNGFTPFFYVKIPDIWKASSVKTFITNLLGVKGYYNGKPYSPLYRWGKHLLKDKCLVQYKKDFYGFSGEKEFKFLRLTFDNSIAMKKFSYAINNHNDPENKCRIKGVNFDLKLYESNLDSILKLMHIRNIKPSGWVNCSNVLNVSKTVRKSRCQIECSTKWTNLTCDVENEKNAPILQASFDIEVYSIDGSFPIPGIKENCVTQIATAFKYFGSDDFYVKHIICLKECPNIERSEDGVEVVVEWYLTEREVLLAWKKLVNSMDPDILYTYNGDQFDCNYLNERAKINRCEESFLDLSKLKNTSSVLIDKQFSSSAYGTSNYKRLSIPGRINFDILIYIQREYKENSYKLDSIAEKYLGQNKIEITPQQMFDFFASGDPQKIKQLAVYCVQDTLLPQRLVDKMHILQNQISMSNVTYVPFKYLVERGQSIKAFSQILRETRKAGYLVPVIKNKLATESFTGATVLPPDTGAYYSPVTVCDFASLYPSIIRAHNLCFSTIVLKEEYGNLPGVDYKTLEWEDEGKKYSYKYAQSTEGVLPNLLKELTVSRKKYKIMMKNATDDFTKEIYNKCQLAVKVSMNSIYGFLAAPMLCCKPIAATVTSYGRNMIADTKKFMEDKYPCSVAVYGDSVAKDTPLLLRKNGKIFIKKISELFDESNKVEYPGFKVGEEGLSEKEYSECSYESWTDNGWKTIKKVIRHKCDKDLVKVWTGDSYINVTADHSLLNEKKEIIKSKDCVINKTVLLNRYPDNFGEAAEGENAEGSFFIGEVPNSVLNGTNYEARKYLDKYFQSNITCNNETVLASIYYLCAKLNLKTKLSDDMIISITEEKIIPGKITAIENVGPTNEYVYDLETSVGRFQAGVGNLIVKNTDSVFVKFKTKSTQRYNSEYDRIYSQVVITERDKGYLKKLKVECIRESIALGKEASKAATENLFIDPICLEYEKVYCPLLLLSKKRYIGELYSENPEKMDYLDNKGVVLKRRDNFLLLRECYQKMVDIFMEDGKKGLDKALKYINTIIEDIKLNNIDKDSLVVTKTLKGPYKSLNIPHVVLSKKLAERDPGNAPRSNDRIPYLFIDNGWTKATTPQYTKVEDPEYAKLHNLPLDTEYYIKFLMNPLCEILELFMDNPTDMFKKITMEYRKERLKRVKSAMK